MIYSMTGFGRGELSTEVFDVTVELKSVNNRYCDILIKMPKKLNVFEDRVKNAIKSKVSRGRVDVYINIEEKSFDSYDVTANYEILDKYVDVYRAVINRYDIKDDIDIAMISKIQDGFFISHIDKDEEEFWRVIEPALEMALENLIRMRISEGEKLKSDVLTKVNNIRKILEEISRVVPQILEDYKQKMRDRVIEILDQTETELDEARLANELAIYADKTNINEEIVRIHSHLNQIDLIMDSNEPIGRKLDFLIQELNREVNTIGSKSPDLDISNRVIELKSEIEQIREQIQNLE